jgi:hypothetical protein
MTDASGFIGMGTMLDWSKKRDSIELALHRNLPKLSIEGSNLFVIVYV